MKQQYLAWVIRYSSAFITVYYGDNDKPPTAGEISNAEEVWRGRMISKHKTPYLIGYPALLTQQDVHNCTRLGLNCSGWMVESTVKSIDWSAPAHGYKPEPEACICVFGRSRYCPVCK